MVTKKTPAKKAPAKKAAPKKTVAKKVVHKTEAEAEAPKAVKPAHTKPASGKYVFATGRRKTAIANVRLFGGSGDMTVNKKPFDTYFKDKTQQETALRPLAITGLVGEYHFTANINGGGRTSQVEALRHGVAQALASLSEDMQKVLKKNGFLTRDDRKKERKKPGLRGARRSPQWAKR